MYITFCIVLNYPFAFAVARPLLPPASPRPESPPSPAKNTKGKTVTKNTKKKTKNEEGEASEYDSTEIEYEKDVNITYDQDKNKRKRSLDSKTRSQSPTTGMFAIIKICVVIRFGVEWKIKSINNFNLTYFQLHRCFVLSIKK